MTDLPVPEPEMLARRVGGGWNHGPCAVCGADLVIPDGRVWGMGEPKRHPWERMCLVRLQRRVKELTERAGEPERGGGE